MHFKSFGMVHEHHKYIVSVCCPSWPRPLTVPTAGHVRSAHAHNWPDSLVLRVGSGNETTGLIEIVNIASRIDADARCAWGMCSIEL